MIAKWESAGRIAVRPLPIFTRRDDDAGVFVSWCPALDLLSQGATETEAREAIAEAVELWLRVNGKRVMARGA